MGEDLAVQNEWREKFAVPLRKRRYLAITVLSGIGSQNTLEALANNEDRILLTPATEQKNGNRQIAWKLFQTVGTLNVMEVADPEYCFWLTGTS
jgi:hypothetical protein